jgi:hypothetical protein
MSSIPHAHNFFGLFRAYALCATLAWRWLDTRQTPPLPFYLIPPSYYSTLHSFSFPLLLLFFCSLVTATASACRSFVPVLLCSFFFHYILWASPHVCTFPLDVSRFPSLRSLSFRPLGASWNYIPTTRVLAQNSIFGHRLQLDIWDRLLDLVGYYLALKATTPSCLKKPEGRQIVVNSSLTRSSPFINSGSLRLHSRSSPSHTFSSHLTVFFLTFSHLLSLPLIFHQLLIDSQRLAQLFRTGLL